MAALTDKQIRFCDEYLIDFNATQAAIRAGYSAKTAYAQGERLLKKVEAKKYLSEKKSEFAQRTEITKERLLDELSKIAFFDIRKIYTVDGGLKNINDFGEEEAGAISGIETYDEKEPDSGMVLGTTKKVKVHSKIAAIERISRMLGYDAPEKKEISGELSFANLLKESGLIDEGEGDSAH